MNFSFAAIASAFVAVLLWSIVPVLMKISLQELDLVSALMTRFIFSALVFLPWFKRVWVKIPFLSARTWLPFVFVIGFIYVVQTLALQAIPASWYIVLFALNPILALFFMRVRFTLPLVASVALAMLGTFFFVDTSELQTRIGWLSWFYFIAGMLAWVAYTVWLPRMQKVYTDLEVTALTSFLGLLTTMVVWVARGVPEILFVPKASAIAVSLGFLIPVAYFTYSKAIRLNPRLGVLSQYLEPVLGMLAAWIYLGEELGLLQLFGTALILLSLGVCLKYGLPNDTPASEKEAGTF